MANGDFFSKFIVLLCLIAVDILVEVCHVVPAVELIASAYGAVTLALSCLMVDIHQVVLVKWYSSAGVKKRKVSISRLNTPTAGTLLNVPQVPTNLNIPTSSHMEFSCSVSHFHG